MIKEYIKTNLTDDKNYNIGLLFQKASKYFDELEDKVEKVNPEIIIVDDDEILNNRIKRYKEALRDYQKFNINILNKFG